MVFLLVAMTIALSIVSVAMLLFYATGWFVPPLTLFCLLLGWGIIAWRLYARFKWWSQDD